MCNKTTRNTRITDSKKKRGTVKINSNGAVSDDFIKNSVVTTATPPIHSIISFIVIVSSSLMMMPSKEACDDIATMDLFTQRLFPNLISLNALVAIRAALATFIFGIMIYTMLSEGWVLTTSYIPTSKLPQTHIVMRGIRTQFPYTSVTWNLLGCSMALSSYIGFQAINDADISPWLLRLGLLCWEAAAPNTLLVSAVVRYVIWPGCLKRTGTSANCRDWKALIWHNANAAISLSEALLLGGLPVYGPHVSVAALLGSSYILFSWLYMYSWPTSVTKKPSADAKEGKVTGGPNFLYFFLDTTNGWTTTYAMYALLVTLMVFHLLFALMGNLMHLVGDDETKSHNLLLHLFSGIVIFSGVCRFSD